MRYDQVRRLVFVVSVGDDAEVRIVVGDVEAVADDVVVVGEFVVAAPRPNWHHDVG